MPIEAQAVDGCELAEIDFETARLLGGRDVQKPARHPGTRRRRRIHQEIRNRFPTVVDQPKILQSTFGHGRLAARADLKPSAAGKQGRVN